MKKALAQGVLVLVLIAGVAAVVFLAYQTTRTIVETNQIYRSGETAIGTITDPDTEFAKLGQTRRASRNIRNLARRPYVSHKIGDETYVFRSIIDAPQFSKGDQVPILYLPDRPEVAEIQYHKGRVISSLLVETGMRIFGGLIFLLMLGLVFWAVFLRD